MSSTIDVGIVPFRLLYLNELRATSSETQAVGSHSETHRRRAARESGRQSDGTRTHRTARCTHSETPTTQGVDTQWASESKTNGGQKLDAIAEGPGRGNTQEPADVHACQGTLSTAEHSIPTATTNIAGTAPSAAVRPPSATCTRTPRAHKLHNAHLIRCL